MFCASVPAASTLAPADCNCAQYVESKLRWVAFGIAANAFSVLVSP